MPNETWVLTDSEQGIHEADFQRSVSGGRTVGRIARRTLRGGVREGVDTIEIDNGKLRFVVVPTRGMGLWKAWLGDTEFGWQSPVRGPVHPQFVPLTEPSGLGWLEGFDELMCRCGLQSNGAPEPGPHGFYRYPLHGRIANRPAHRVEAGCDESGWVRLTGIVDETRFLFHKLRLESTYSTAAGQDSITIEDKVTNLSGDPAEMQMLYHVNFGPPLLDPGARVVAPVSALVPRDARAAEGVDNWDTYPNEQAGFTEQVYFARLLADGQGQVEVLLKNAHASQGVSLRYAQHVLPCFTLWKNTPLAADGYVTGLEPGTNFPNPRSFEGEQGRVVKLAGGASVSLTLSIQLLGDAQAVSVVEKRIAAVQGTTRPQVFATPQSGWTRLDI